MAVMQIKGMEEYTKKIKDLAKNEEKVIKTSVYVGAGVIADAVKVALKTLPVEEGGNGLPPFGTQERPISGVSRQQKGDLIDGMGLAPIKESKPGYISTKLGWAGYGRVKTKRYPNGVPNQMLMRAVEGGTSFRRKTLVVRKSVRKAKQQAVEAMGRRAEEEIRKEI